MHRVQLELHILNEKQPNVRRLTLTLMRIL
jgi:hypothetical protein